MDTLSRMRWCGAGVTRARTSSLIIAISADSASAAKLLLGPDFDGLAPSTHGNDRHRPAGCISAFTFTGLAGSDAVDERMRFSNDVDAERPGFYFEVLAFKANNKPIEAYLAEFPLREPADAVSHAHAGAELVHLLEGQLEVVYQEDTVILEAGDSAYFDSSEVHSYRGISEKSARAFVISVPVAG